MAHQCPSDQRFHGYAKLVESPLWEKLKFIEEDSTMKMRQITLVAALVLALLAGMCLTVMAKDMAMTAKGQEVTLNGTLTCTFCSLSHPEKPCAKGCCAQCMKAGDPPMLTDAKGNQYVLLTGEVKTPLMNAERMEMAGGPVTVKGMLVKGKGIQAIFVESIKKAGK
jgi:hypothetical protein